MAAQPSNHPTYPSQPGQPTYDWSIPVDQGPPPAYNPNSQPNQQPAPASNMHGGAVTNESGGLGDAVFAFSEYSIRMAFVRKVFTILMVQLVITVGFISLFVYEPNVEMFFREYPEIWWTSFISTFILLIVLGEFNDLRRRWPLNIILLGLFTFCEGFLLGTASSVYDSDDVLIATGICMAVCLALTIFAMQTKWDFTTYGGILFVSLVVLFIFGIVSIFIPGKAIDLFYDSLGAILFSAYLVYDVQLMLGGKHKHSISPEEYIFAALNLYIDVIAIFKYILKIISNRRK